MTDRHPDLLAVDGLRVETTGGREIVRGVSLAVGRGELVGLIGESGSGKTTVALACLGYARPGLRIAGGAVRVGEVDLLQLPERAVRALRGDLVAYVPQDPGASLNPAYRVADHLAEARRDRPQAPTAEELLRRVCLPDDPGFLRRYTHQLSGGQQQRIAIAMALAGGAELILLDEPTTGLDAVTKAALLRELRDLCESGISAVLVSHDLAAVSGIADRVAVMYDGVLVEQGPLRDVLTAPLHPYTDALIAAVPAARSATRPAAGPAAGEPPAATGCPYATRCARADDACRAALPAIAAVGARAVRCLHPLDGAGLVHGAPVARLAAADAAPALCVADLRAEHGGRAVVDGVGFEVRTGECVALVGESGSGKTTIARCVVGLHRPAAGSVELDGRALAPTARARSRDERAAIQIVFQNPSSALNPRLTVGEAIARPPALLHGASAEAARREVDERLAQVRLPAAMAARLPHELSGGERQRVAIACALAARPRVLVCDEVTSALDVSVQASVLDLLADLRLELGLSMLFITHDLGVVNALADRTIVLAAGRIVEAGPTDDVLGHPREPYTGELLAASATLPAAER
ncbi:MAG: oligopeptide/dipeptide ABC transporter ATP-binding protein [Actinomycetota bacterium]